MKGKKLIIYSCFSALIILLSFVIYYGFSIGDKTEIQNAAFAFIISTEIIFFGMIYVVTRKDSNAFTRAGISSASIIYIGSSLILNIFIKSIFKTLRTLIITNIMLLIIYIAIILVIYLFKREK